MLCSARRSGAKQDRRVLVVQLVVHPEPAPRLRHEVLDHRCVVAVDLVEQVVAVGGRVEAVIPEQQSLEARFLELLGER